MSSRVPTHTHTLIFSNKLCCGRFPSEKLRQKWYTTDKMLSFFKLITKILWNFLKLPAKWEGKQLQAIRWKREWKTFLIRKSSIVVNISNICMHFRSVFGDWSFCPNATSSYLVLFHAGSVIVLIYIYPRTTKCSTLLFSLAMELKWQIKSYQNTLAVFLLGSTEHQGLHHLLLHRIH